MTATPEVLVETIRDRLHAVSDPTLAPAQQAYMRSAMPFLGIRVPRVRREARLAAAGIRDAHTLIAAAETLWDVAEYREERYAALAVLGLPVLRGDITLGAVVERMVREGRWWDFTDELAHRVADLHDTHPVAAAAVVRRWSTDEDLWIRRIAIISQLGRRERVDPVLLADVLAPNLADPDFFIRKAIGWALREYARVAPEWVSVYVGEHDLSPLSRREALRHLSPSVRGAREAE